MERELDFSANKTQVLTLQQLERTYRETYCDGTPIGVYHHADLLNQILDIFSAVSNDVEIINITAINNRDKYHPGVTILKEMQDKFGEGSAESHLLRRIVCNIRLSKVDENGEDYHLAISWYQGGCSIGIGPHVYACNNGCILSAEHVFSTRTWWVLGKKYNPYKQDMLIPTLQEWANSLTHCMEVDFMSLDRLKNSTFQMADVYRLIGTLQMSRVLMDSDLSKKEAQFTAPLLQKQINMGCEILTQNKFANQDKNSYTGFELLNIFNQSIKPSFMDAVDIIPEQIALYETIISEIPK